MKRLIFFFALLFTALPVMAQTAQDVDVNDPASVVAYLTTFIVLAVTWLVRKLRPSIPGWATMLVVVGLSSAASYLTGLVGNPELGWLAQFGLGLASTFVHQLYKQFTAN